MLARGFSTLPLLTRNFATVASTQHVTKISDLSPKMVNSILSTAMDMKRAPLQYSSSLSHKTLLMLFEKPSLRTRVSFETGMTQMGGHAIFYSISDSPLGKKENIEDTAKVLGRYVDFVMARVKSRDTITALAEHSSVPIINGLDDFAHPCQILADLMTIQEKKGSLKGLKMAYIGDALNNVTYDLMRAACMTGMHINVGCPGTPYYTPEKLVVDECTELSKAHGGTFSIVSSAKEAAEGCDVIYTDSWMSYGIPEAEQQARMDALLPFRVDIELLKRAARDVVFMNCLPAMRGMEQTAEVIDGSHSIVFDQAENRLHAQKSLLLHLTEKHSA